MHNIPAFRQMCFLRRTLQDFVFLWYLSYSWWHCKCLWTNLGSSVWNIWMGDYPFRSVHLEICNITIPLHL